MSLISVMHTCTASLSSLFFSQFDWSNVSIHPLHCSSFDVLILQETLKAPCFASVKVNVTSINVTRHSVDPVMCSMDHNVRG